MKGQVGNIFNISTAGGICRTTSLNAGPTSSSRYARGCLVEEHENRPLLDIIIPELPIKIDEGDRSFKVDYVLFSKDTTIAYFVELETDGGSQRMS